MYYSLYSPHLSRIVCPNVYSQCKEPNCGYAGLETDLARHTNFKHRKEKIPCSVCGKLVQENSLKNHIVSWKGCDDNHDINCTWSICGCLVRDCGSEGCMKALKL